MGHYRFFENYAMLLVTLVEMRGPSTRSLAINLNITQRCCQTIIKDLKDQGFINIKKQPDNKRRNLYTIYLDSVVHRFPGEVTLLEFLRLFGFSDFKNSENIIFENKKGKKK